MAAASPRVTASCIDAPAPRRAVRRPEQESTGADSLNQALAVLDLFTMERRAWAVDELARALGVRGATLAPILLSLCEHGMLDHDAERGCYTAGMRSLELATAFRLETPLASIAEPVLADIRDRLNETTMLAVRWRDHRVNIAQALSSRPLRQDIPLGLRKPLYIGAGGKILLAGLGDVELAGYLRRVRLERASPTTTTDPLHLTNVLAAIRCSGYAETFSERNSGGASFGAAVRDRRGAIAAALVVSLPLNRFSPQLRPHIRQLLMNGVEEIRERAAMTEED